MPLARSQTLPDNLRDRMVKLGLKVKEVRTAK
jgi:hypothetical protein